MCGLAVAMAGMVGCAKQPPPIPLSEHRPTAAQPHPVPNGSGGAGGATYIEPKRLPPGLGGPSARTPQGPGAAPSH